VEKDEITVIAELAEMRRLLERIADATETPLGLIAQFKRVRFAGGTFVDVDLGGVFDGLWIYNNSGSVMRIGFGPGEGSPEADRWVLLLPDSDGGGARWLAIPYRTSLVSIGGADDGDVVIAPLFGAVPPGGA
jgi:hypothetical protein